MVSRPLLDWIGLRARVEEHEAAGAVGVLGLAGRVAGLAEEGRLLVAQVAGDRDRLARSARRRGRRPRLEGRICGSIAVGMPMSLRISGSQSRVSRSISMVRLALVTSVTWTPPLTPPVRFQMHQVSMLPKSRSPASALARGARDVVEDPLDLRPGEVGGQRQAGLGRKRSWPPSLASSLQMRVGAGVLPDDGVVDRLAGLLSQTTAVSRWLVTPDRGDVRALMPAFCSAPLITSWQRVQISSGVVLDPARLRVDLLVLLLVDRRPLPRSG